MALKRKYVRYGGIGFSSNVSPQKINRFVRDLPADKRDSMYEVVKELKDNNMISIHSGDFSTIDDDTIHWQE